MRKAIKKKVIQGLGKIRRFAYHKLRKDKLAEKLALRKGECLRCGACCKLLFKCPMLLEHGDGSTSCRVHQRRPDNCRIFPIDRRDLEERNHLNPLVPCGYRFPDNDGGEKEKDK